MIDASAARRLARGRDHAPDDVQLHLRVASALLAQDDKIGAAAAYHAALAVDPAHFEARLRLAHVLKLDSAYAEAAAILDALIADHPTSAAVHKEIGRLHFAQHRLDAANASFTTVVQLNANDADAYHWLANIENTRGNTAAALAYYRRTLALKAFMRVPAAKSPADFSVLFLFAPGNANTPPDALIKGAPYDSCFALFLPDVDYDVDALRGAAQLVVNLISDVDRAGEMLALAQSLVERIGLPVVNQPHAIALTDRESVAARLAGIPYCHIPTVRRSAAEDVAGDIERFGLRFPLLIRLAGTHGGEDFEKAESVTGVNDFVARHPGAQFYLTQYADYRSADGFFRKYRLFFVADQILPYHLAIDAGWKVHHATTDMANHPWMQHEEKAFLDDPATALGQHHLGALRAIRDAIGLDFFGIDCAIDAADRLVVFEVNATMLVHQNFGPFAYKAQAVDAIKHAFDAMLRERALRAGAQDRTVLDDDRHSGATSKTQRPADSAFRG